MVEISPDMLALIERTHLEFGSHRDPSEGMCAMELVAFVAGEPFSDHPECVCPVLGAFVRAWNDGLPDDERDAILKPLLPRLIATRGSHKMAERRALMTADWLVRVHTPAWLRLAKLDVQADTLATLPEITSMAQVSSIRGPLEAARDAARVVAWDAARVVARDAARVVAWDAARDAARAVARDAARAVARDAAREALNPTRAALQNSARDLVVRMIDAQEVTS